jgi:hypothetical protein
VASILELPIEDVPHFLIDAKLGEHWSQAQWNSVWDFAESHGLLVSWISMDTRHELVPDLEARGIYYIATGVPAGQLTLHSVVMRGGKVEHDPSGTSAPFVNGPILWIYFIPYMYERGKMTEQVETERERLEQQATHAMHELDTALKHKDQAIERLVEFNSQHGTADGEDE